MNYINLIAPDQCHKRLAEQDATSVNIQPSSRPPHSAEELTCTLWWLPWAVFFFCIHASCNAISHLTGYCHVYSLSVHLSVSQVAFTSLFMNIPSASDLFNLVVSPFSAHTSSHKHTLRLHNTQTGSEKFPLCVWFISCTHVCSAFKKHSSHTVALTHTHAHTFILRTCQ